MTASLSGVFNLQQFTSAGELAASHRLYTYAASTTTQKTAYTDEAGTIPHTYTSDGIGGQYIALNSRGELPAPLFLTAGGYDIALKTPAGATVWTRRAVGQSDESNKLRDDLTSTSDGSKGPGLIPFNRSLTFVSGSAGEALRNAACDPENISKQIRLQGGAVRRESGAWSFIDDSGHTPLGFTGASELDAYTLRVTFNGDNTKVGTLLAVIDKELAPYGIIGGCSCSTNHADFSFFAPVVADLQSNNVISVAPWLSSYVTLNMSGTYSTIINHPPRALNVDPPGVTLLNRSAGASRQPALTWGTTTTTITTLGTLGAVAQRTGSGVFTTTNQSAQGTVSNSWSSGLLKITHPDCGVYSIPDVSPLDTPYRPEVKSWTATTIDVQFRNAAGAIVTPTDDSNMKCFWTRDTTLFPVPMPSTFSARIDLGMLQIPLAAIENISLNNFWLIGAMFKE